MILRNDPLQGYRVMAAIVATLASRMLSHEVKRLHYGLVLVVIGAQVQNLKKLWYHAAVVMAIGAAHHGVDFLRIRTTGGAVFFDEIA